jgi:GR25 family glycosyltransferase involved in LPS biosynthesis
MEIPVYLINLKNREDRLLNSLNELRKVNLTDKVIRKEACDSIRAKKLAHQFTTPKVKNNIEVNLKSTKIMPTWASLGCAISHYECWKDMINKNFNYSLILEDDIEITDPDKFLFSINDSIRIINQRSYVYGEDISLFISLNSKISNNKTQIKEDMYQFYNEFIGTSCYLINNKCAKLLSEILPFKYQLDIHIGRNISRLSYKHQSKYLAIYNSGISNKYFVSDVQYYFIELLELQKLFNNLLPIEIIENIYIYLPHQKNFNNFYDNDNYNLYSYESLLF